MSHLEDEFKRRFLDKSSLDGIDPEGIWAGLEEALPETVSTPIDKDKDSNNRRFYLLLAFLFFVVSGVLIFSLNVNGDKNKMQPSEIPTELQKEISSSQLLENQRNEQQNAPETSNGASEKGHKFETLNKKDSNPNFVQENTLLNTRQKEQLVKKQNENRKKVIKQAEEHKITNNNYKSTETGSKKVNNNKNAIKANQETKKNTINTLPFDNKNVALVIQDIQKKAIVKKSDFLEKKTIISFDKDIGIIANTKVFDPLFAPTLKMDISAFEHRISPPAKTNKLNLIKVDKKGSKNLTIGFFAGANVFSNSYQHSNELSDLKKTLKTTHQNKAGYSASLELRWNPFRHVHFISGLEHTSLRTKFNIVQISDSTLLKGNEIVPAIATRTVVHNNQQNFISIPLLVGVEKQLGIFRIGVNAGIGLNYFVKQKGKSLNSQSVVAEFDQSKTTVLPSTKSFISYRINPYLEYQASQKLAIQLRPEFRFQDHGRSELYGLKQTSLLSGLKVGLLIGL